MWRAPCSGTRRGAWSRGPASRPGRARSCPPGGGAVDPRGVSAIASITLVSPCGTMPRAVAAASGTEAAISTGARSTIHTPSGNVLRARPRQRRARGGSSRRRRHRVRVTSRSVRRRSTTVSRSRSRPTIGVASVGRFPRVGAVTGPVLHRRSGSAVGRSRWWGTEMGKAPDAPSAAIPDHRSRQPRSTQTAGDEPMTLVMSDSVVGTSTSRSRSMPSPPGYAPAPPLSRRSVNRRTRSGSDRSSASTGVSRVFVNPVSIDHQSCPGGHLWQRGSEQHCMHVSRSRARDRHHSTYRSTPAGRRRNV